MIVNYHEYYGKKIPKSIREQQLIHSYAYAKEFNLKTIPFTVDFLKDFNIKTIFYNPSDLNTLKKNISKNTKLIFVENPGSNTFDFQDLSKIIQIAKKHKNTTECYKALPDSAPEAIGLLYLESSTKPKTVSSSQEQPRCFVWYVIWAR